MTQEQITTHEEGFLSKFSPKASFFLGLGSSLAIFFVIGFFVLPGIFLRGGAASLNSASGESPTAQVPQPSPNEPDTGPITLQPITSKDWVKGNRNAKISVVEFSDTECPFCQRFHPTMQQVISTYGDKVNWVYRHFPLTSLHPKAPKEAEATECAGELGGNDAFWRYVDRLFEITPANNGLDPAELPKIAEFVGLNRGRFEECLNSGKYAQKVQDHADQAVAAGGRGTPYSVIVVGDQKIPVSGAVPFEQLKNLINSALQ